MLDMPINSTVSSSVSDTTVSLDAAGYIEVRGYAVPHGDQGLVVRVQVSGDEGTSWTDAGIEDWGRQGSKWSWVLWKARIKLQRESKGRSLPKRQTRVAIHRTR